MAGKSRPSFRLAARPGLPENARLLASDVLDEKPAFIALHEGMKPRLEKP